MMNKALLLSRNSQFLYEINFIANSNLTVLTGENDVGPKLSNVKHVSYIAIQTVILETAKWQQQNGNHKFTEDSRDKII